LKRGAIWTAAGGEPYAGKPRPVVIVQDDRFDGTASMTVVPLTTDPTEAPFFRLRVEPDDNGLEAVSTMMVDKITTIPKARLGRRVGRLADEDMVRLTRAIVVFLELAGPATNPPKGDNHRVGAVRGQSMDRKADDKPFKGVRKEK